MDKDLTYDEWTQKVKIGILTEAGNCPVTSLIICYKANGNFRLFTKCVLNPLYVLAN